MDREGILQCLRKMFDSDWPWDPRQIDEYRYMIRFPDNKRVEEIAMGDVIWFPLNKDGVMASLKVWDGEVKSIGKLTECWVQVRGIPPKWYGWHVFQQVDSSLGKMVEVDWYSIFANHFEMVRIKVKCKDPAKIPIKRILEMNDEMFLLSYKVEDWEQVKKKVTNDGGGDDDEDDDPGLDEEEDLLDDSPDDNQLNRQSGSKSKPKPDDPKSDQPPSASGSERRDRGPGANSDHMSKAQKSLMKKKEEGEMEDQYCINLLRAMELVDKDENMGEEEEEEQLKYNIEEDDEAVNLPEEWIYSITERRGEGDDQPQDQETFFAHEKKCELTDDEDTQKDQCERMEMPRIERPKRGNRKWGPVQAEKKSARLINDGRTALEKAQNLKRKVNLEEKPEWSLEGCSLFAPENCNHGRQLEDPMPSRERARAYAETYLTEMLDQAAGETVGGSGGPLKKRLLELIAIQEKNGCRPVTTCDLMELVEGWKGDLIAEGLVEELIF